MMDFVFDYISVNAFWTIVLIVHALLAVATLGALTHQAMSVAMPARQAAGPVRIPLERTGYWKTLGFFELKEHIAALGLGLLPAYWYFWKNPKNPAYDSARKAVTLLLAAMCWFAFLVGHVLNNARGFG